MDATFSEILVILKKYWTDDKNGNAREDVARTVINLMTVDFPEFNSDTTYKTIFKNGPSKRATEKILNSLAGSESFDDYIKNHISGSGRKNLAQELKELTGVEMDRGTVGRVCYNLLVKSLRLENHLKNNKNKKIPTKESEDESAITKTVSDEMFSSVFREVNVSDMDIVKNTNLIHAFVLKPELLPFSYKNLKELVMNNITNYAVARGINKNDITGLRAGRLLRKYVKSGIPSNLLGELLIYIFLEHEENAVKLYTRAEISDINRTIDSEGLYLKTDEAKNQLILSASQLNDNLQDAVTNVVKRLSEFENNQSDELKLATDMVDMSIIQSQFDEKKSQSIIRSMAPQESNLEDIASYGLFIGYQFRTESDLENCTQEEAKQRCCESIINDLQQTVSQLSVLIQMHHWQKSSFYVYLLPFTNAEEDSRIIMDDLIGV